MGLKNPTYVNYLYEEIAQLKVKLVNASSKDKLESLVKLLCHLGNQPGIIFCSYNNTILQVSEYLIRKNIGHGCFYGGMEQIERERVLIKFRNGTYRLLLATDLAARGIDDSGIKFIVLYHLPQRSREFTHRKGRTARMNNDGTAYILKLEKDTLLDFIKNLEREHLSTAPYQFHRNGKHYSFLEVEKIKYQKEILQDFLLNKGN